MLRLSITTLLDLGVILRNQRCSEITVQRSTRRNHAQGVDEAGLERNRNAILRGRTLALREQTALRTASALKQTRLKREGNILRLETPNVLENTLRATAIILADIVTDELGNLKRLSGRHIAFLTFPHLWCVVEGRHCPCDLTCSVYHNTMLRSTFFFESGMRQPVSHPVPLSTLPLQSTTPCGDRQHLFFVPALEPCGDRGTLSTTEQGTVYHGSRLRASTIFASLFKGLAGIALEDRRVVFRLTRGGWHGRIRMSTISSRLYP